MPPDRYTTAHPTSATPTYKGIPERRRRTLTNSAPAAAISVSPIHNALGIVGAVRRKSPTGQMPASWKTLSGP